MYRLVYVSLNSYKSQPLIFQFMLYNIFVGFLTSFLSIINFILIILLFPLVFSSILKGKVLVTKSVLPSGEG